MQKTWNIVIGIGALMMFSGLLFLPAALAPAVTDEAMLAGGLAVFSTGVMLMACSFYFKAKGLSQASADPSAGQTMKSRKGKAQCDSCRSAAPVIYCTMHKLSLCGNCLSEHYEARGCVYTPAVRKPVSRTARGAATGRA